MPVRPRSKRRMSKSELKDALRDTMEVKERREERQEERQEMDEKFEFEEETLEDKINSLQQPKKHGIPIQQKESSFQQTTRPADKRGKTREIHARPPLGKRQESRSHTERIPRRSPSQT